MRIGGMRVLIFCLMGMLGLGVAMTCRAQEAEVVSRSSICDKAMLNSLTDEARYKKRWSSCFRERGGPVRGDGLIRIFISSVVGGGGGVGGVLRGGWPQCIHTHIRMQVLCNMDNLIIDQYARTACNLASKTSDSWRFLL